MFDFFSKPLSQGGFMPHGMCYQWRPDVLWTHVISDLVIAIAYVSIPIALTVLLVKRRRFPLKWIIALFAGFILLCGTSHVLGIVVVWHPVYGLQGLVKLATAAVSITTAVVVFPLLPQLLSGMDGLEQRVRADAASDHDISRSDVERTLDAR